MRLEKQARSNLFTRLGGTARIATVLGLLAVSHYMALQTGFHLSNPKSITFSGAEYVTLQSYFSHPSFSYLLFSNPLFDNNFPFNIIYNTLTTLTTIDLVENFHRKIFDDSEICMIEIPLSMLYGL
jgi:hypothetical protein